MEDSGATSKSGGLGPPEPLPTKDDDELFIPAVRITDDVLLRNRPKSKYSEHTCMYSMCQHWVRRSCPANLHVIASIFTFEWFLSLHLCKCRLGLAFP